MKESIANSYIFTLIIIFVGVIIILLIGSISYSKTFKIKNRIIDLIETNQGWDDNLSHDISEVLKNAGYKINHVKSENACRVYNASGQSVNPIYDGAAEGDYQYCVYEIGAGGRGTYYHVVVYMSFDFPFIGDYMVFPLGGDTKLIYDL